jgi:hypothetical protein
MKKLVLGFLWLATALPVHGEDGASGGGPSWLPQVLGAQVTEIRQSLRPFRSPYSGPNSLESRGDNEGTQTYGIYLGSELTSRLQVYFDAEMARGAGVGHAVGLAGITNGDVIRQGTADLGNGPYVARAFLRYLMPLSSETAPVERGVDHLPGAEAERHVEWKLGRLAASDDFDQNRYASSTRTQFLDWGLFNNSAWDFAADTRGYTNGLVVGWIEPRFALRFGSFQMTTQANGNVFDGDLRRARGDNLELTLCPSKDGPVVRLLAFRNLARMGIYREALVIAAATGTVPNIVADDRPGRVKYGFGLSFEQPLADEGETGVFLRLGWDDGKTESFAFTEVDRQASTGLQLAGTAWHRSADRLSLALLVHGLSPEHRDYLAAGGSGFLLGDGNLRYSEETIGEAYYRVQIGKWLEVSPDFQYISNPGYNRDRGPAKVWTLRLNVHG